MKKISTTVVAIVGAKASEAAEDLDRAANVAAIIPDHDDPPLERAVTAWRSAVRTHRPFTVHDADPLGPVREAWVGFYDEKLPRGALETATFETLARWRAGSLELPDYYFVLGAEELPTTDRHWFLGLLHERAPHRVVPVAADGLRLREALNHLRPGRWWTELDDLLAEIDRVVPDRVGVPTEPEPGEHGIVGSAGTQATAEVGLLRS